jgi:nucleotide-binding universal stress UspA family protein
MGLRRAWHRECNGSAEEDVLMLAFRNILVPTDFSVSSSHVVEVAVDLARTFGAGLTLLHVYEIPSYMYMGAWIDVVTPIEQAAQAELDTALASVRKTLPAARAELRCGVPWTQVLDVARESGADLIVMGTHGRTGVSHALLGSVAERVVRSADVPVLTVRASKHAEEPIASRESSALT